MANTVDNLIADIDRLRATAEALKHDQQTDSWHFYTEIPEDGLYIVATASGAIFVSQPLGGKWMKQVRWWMRIPKHPDQA